MPGDLARKFRIMADIIQAVGKQHRDAGTLAFDLSRSGIVRKGEIEALTVLARELGFIKEAGDKTFERTREGAVFERLVVEMDSRKEHWSHPPLEQTIELMVCATVPPRWFPAVSTMFGDRVQRTMSGPRMVVEEASAHVTVVSPFIDTQVLQMCLENVYAKNLEFDMVTSEPKLARQYLSGHNYEREKL